MAQSRRSQEESKSMAHKQDEQEPESTDRENIIQMLDDHIAVSPNPAQASTEKETDSGLEEPLTHEQDNKDKGESDTENGVIDVVATSASDTDNQEVEVVATSSSDPEEIIVVDSTNTETFPEAGVQTPISNKGSETMKENNNNQEEEKAILELPTNRQLPSQTPRKQLLLHQVPISFPVPSNLMESMDSLMFIQEALLSLVEDLPGDALVDAAPLHRVNSYQDRTAVILTFDAEQTRDRIMKAVREGSTSSSGSGGTRYYFTEVPKRTKVNRQTHIEDETRNEAGSSKGKKMKSKPTAVVLAAKVKEKYSALDEEAKKRKKKGGYVYDGTKARLIEMRRDPGNVSTPIAKTSDLSNLVQDISSVVPISRIDTLQAPEPMEPDEQNFHESTRRDDAEAEEECLRDETRLVEDIERYRNRVNSDCELRETMRPRSGPADLECKS